MKKLLFFWAMAVIVLLYVFITPLFFTPYPVPIKFPNNYEMHYENSIMLGNNDFVVTESIDGIIKRANESKNKMIMVVLKSWGMNYWLSDSGVLYHAWQEIPVSWWNFLQMKTRYDSASGAIIVSGGGAFHYVLGILVAAIFFFVGLIWFFPTPAKRKFKDGF